MIAPTASDIGSAWLMSATRPRVASAAVRPEQERDPGCDERPERDEKDQQRQRHGEEPGLLQIAIEILLDRLPGALAERPDEEPGVCFLDLLDTRDDRIDLVGSVLRRTADLHRDEHRVLVRGDLTAVLGVERRLDLRDRIEARDSTDDGLHDCLERGRGCPERRVLDQDALTARLLEVLVEDRVRPSRLARS